MIDDPLQVFLTIYFGTLIGTFFYDYVVRNVVNIIVEGDLTWPWVTNIALGIIFIVIIIWAIYAVWLKQKGKLLIVLIVLIVIFLVRLGVGISDLYTRSDLVKRTRAWKEEVTVFIVQMIVHLFGVIATGMLWNRIGGK
jgi:hypothetical protein